MQINHITGVRLHETFFLGIKAVKAKKVLCCNFWGVQVYIDPTKGHIDEWVTVIGIDVVC